MYAVGEFVGRSLAEAARWYRRAAEQNLAQAQFQLGMMRLQGLGLAQDLVEAETWLWFASEQRQPAAQFNLGLKYARGDGVARDYAQAHMWLSLALAGTAVGKRDEITRSLNHLDGLMAPEQRAVARRRAEAWRATHGG